MFNINLIIFAYFCATFFTATCILGQAQFYRKPWPTYSLENMPQTRFRCHDKILGGYYADAETQCQMFHVCVKVSGVGVQDFRFLCPNGTAFDQEAQICADWGDVDCEQSVLYYGSDNFDLYRIGSGFESKRAPLAEEEEATFHLQRAESADIRRSKETRIDQKSRPDQPPNYTRHFEATTRNSFNNYAHLNENNRNQQQQQQQLQQQKKIDAAQKPIANYYTPTTTTTTTTERYTDESKQEYDDIFKGSHSSHFFANRNGGREDDFLEHQQTKAKPNDFTDYNRKAETSTSGKTRVPPTRSKRIQTPTTSTTTTTTSTTPTPTTTAVPVSSKLTTKINLQSFFNTDFFGHTPTYKASTPNTSAGSAATTSRPSYSNANRFNFGANDYQTQEKIQPTTYNPANSIYRLKATTPKYTEFSRQDNSLPHKTTKSAYNDQSVTPQLTKEFSSKPTISSRKSQKLERSQQKADAVDTSLVNNQNEFSRITKPQQAQPQPFQPLQVFRAPPATQNTKPAHIEPQFYRSRGSPLGQQQLNGGNQAPSPFVATQNTNSKQRVVPADNKTEKAERSKQKATNSPDVSPRGFTSRGSINYKATTQRNGELYTPTTTALKKFSTLVPKDQYTPTTFKPTTYKKPYENNYNFYQTQQTVRAPNRPQQASVISTTTTQAPNTAHPANNADEDDGQYHPELYEIDFPRNRLNLQRSSKSTTTGTSSTTITTTTTKRPLTYNHNFQNPLNHLKTQQQTSFQKQQEQATPVDLSDEEELFKTAHSLNFGAASINKLRADIIKAEKTSQQYNSQYSPNVPASSPRTAATPHNTPSTSGTTSYSAVTTSKPYASSYLPTTTSSTTVKPPIAISTTLKAYVIPKSTKTSRKSSKGKGKKGHSKKRPAHADEDTSYDYAYYDTDTLSEAPQEYQEYEFAEFARTRKN